MLGSLQCLFTFIIEFAVGVFMFSSGLKLLREAVILRWHELEVCDLWVHW